jgi:hypothetical protein
VRNVPSGSFSARTARLSKCMTGRSCSWHAVACSDVSGAVAQDAWVLEASDYYQPHMQVPWPHPVLA